MRGLQLSRQQRRRMERLVADNEPTIAADAKFFERRPDRTFRIRRMSRSELSQAEVAAGHPVMTAPGSAPFTVVKNLAPGVRLRIFVPGPGNEDGNTASDEVGAFIWRQYAEDHPDVAEREEAFRTAMFKPGGPFHQAGGPTA